MSARRTLGRLLVTLLLGAVLAGTGGRPAPVQAAPQFDAWFVCANEVHWYFYDSVAGANLEIVVYGGYPYTELGADTVPGYGGGLASGTIDLPRGDLPSVLKVTLWIDGVPTLDVFADVPLCDSSFVDDTVACLATAALAGSPQEPGLDTLRGFRDDVLDATALGRSLVRAYYAVSPPLAAYLVRHQTARDAVRGTLIPVIYGLEHPWPTGMAALAAAGLLTLLAWRRRTRRR